MWLSDKKIRCCYNCKHYHQHYVYSLWQFVECYAGHCVYPRIKIRKPSDVCDRFEEKECAKAKKKL